MMLCHFTSNYVYSIGQLNLHIVETMPRFRGDVQTKDTFKIRRQGEMETSGRPTLCKAREV